ncbi:DUF1015 family protein [Spartinivicinus ruber]|uniref:DUF1015 family protein n=1 Tax=Spartinivicinus ruber TaxID=2683272 RepID=UPI0013D0D8F6|nr:DUF1015 family protein [Spartinivicinus ruber]
MDVIEQTLQVSKCKLLHHFQVAASTNNLLLYRIEGLQNGEYHQITGILTQFNNRCWRVPVYPHEQVDYQKVCDIQQSITKSKAINTPSYFVTKSDSYPKKKLDVLFDSGTLIAKFTNNALSHSVVCMHDADHIKEVISAIECIEDFLIADGHHRFTAYQQQVNSGIETVRSLPVFITHASQARVKSFELICRLTANFNWQRFAQYIRQLGLLSCNRSIADYLITYQNEQLAVAFDSRINRQDDTKRAGYHFELIIEKLTGFSGIDFISSEALEFYEENNEANSQLGSRSHQYLFIKTKSPSIDTIYQDAINGYLCPKKSTCFLFKPHEDIIDYLQQELRVAS